ncbi:unnamed protein product [Rhodiola kirilowii]
MHLQFSLSSWGATPKYSEMWSKMACSQCLATIASCLSNCMIAGLGLMLAATLGSFSLGCIFFTSTFLVVSAVTLFFSQNPKACACIPNHEKQEELEERCSEPRTESKYPEEVTEQVADHKNIFQIHKETQGQECCGSMHRALNYLTTISENESLGDDDQSIITSDADEDLRDNYGARSSLSSAEDDGSISDEDTLIEIELPTGHYLSPKELEQHRFKLKQKLPNYYYYSCNSQEQIWMELLSAEANELLTEEDNLIEIDISAGSIMCPRFEIEA